MTTLPVELYRNVVHEVARDDLVTLLSTSRVLRSEAERILYASLWLRLDLPSDLDRLKWFIQRASRVGKHVRLLSLDSLQFAFSRGLGRDLLDTMRYMENLERLGLFSSNFNGEDALLFGLAENPGPPFQLLEFDVEYGSSEGVAQFVATQHRMTRFRYSGQCWPLSEVHTPVLRTLSLSIPDSLNMLSSFTALRHLHFHGSTGQLFGGVTTRNHVCLTIVSLVIGKMEHMDDLAIHFPHLKYLETRGAVRPPLS